MPTYSSVPASITPIDLDTWINTQIPSSLANSVNSLMDNIELRIADWPEFNETPGSDISAILRQIKIHVCVVASGDTQLVLNSALNSIGILTRDHISVLDVLDPLGIEEVICTSCSDYIGPSHPQRIAYHEEVICGSCCDEYYRFDEREGTLVAEGDVDNYEENSCYNGLYSYDFDPLNVLPHFINTNREFKRKDSKKFTPMLLGVELEVERRGDAEESIAQKIADSVSGWAILKHDGSLENGFEIVSAPCTFDYHKWGQKGKVITDSPWHHLLKNRNLMKNLKSYSTDTCGVHIHLSRAALTPLQIGKMTVFLNSDDNYEFLSRIVGRGSTFYAQRENNMKITDPIHPINICDRRVWFNLTKRNTVELRMFRGNTKYEGMMRYIEFAQSLYEFTKFSSMRHLHIKSYFKWLENKENFSRFNNLYDFCLNAWPDDFKGNQRKRQSKSPPPSRIDTGMSLTQKECIPAFGELKGSSSIPTDILRTWPNVTNTLLVQQIADMNEESNICV